MLSTFVHYWFLHFWCLIFWVPLYNPIYSYVIVTFKGPEAIVISGVYYWINLPFLVLSEIWLSSCSTQMLQLKLLSKLTDSAWLVIASHWLALLGFKLTLPICSNILPPPSSLDSATPSVLAWTISTQELTQLHSTALTALTPNWLTEQIQLNWLKLNWTLHWTASNSIRSHFQAWLLPSIN